MKNLILFLSILACSVSQAQVSRSNFNAPFEIKDHILFGGGFSELTGYNSLKSALGKNPATYLVYVSMSSSWLKMTFNSKLSNIKKVPAGTIIILNICTILDNEKNEGRARQGAIEFANTTKWDDNARYLINQMKALNRPVIFAFGYEYDHRNMGYSQKEFKLAYQKFVRMYREIGGQFSNIWVSAGISSGRGIAEKFGWYPGDEYVDWFGYNLYNVQDELGNIKSNKPRLPAFCDSAVRRGKPVGIVESAANSHFSVVNGQASVDKWFKPFIEELVYKLPAIKMWNYCNINWNDDPNSHGSGYTKDAQVQSNAVVYNYFKSFINHPIWVFGDGVIKPVETTPSQPDPVIFYDTIRTKVFYPVYTKVTHDTTLIKDSIRIDIRPRSL